ncbi:MAG: alkaline phosphatase, partial [Caulobacteraceae bacterium]
MDRRSLLGLLGAGAASPAVAQGTNTGSVAFLHGVASGDPDTRSAVFWTRVTPADPSVGDVAVVLEVAHDAGFGDIVRRSTGLRARAERDFTVKHDLDGQGLEPGVEYFYRFVANGVTSPVGRVRTLPEGATADLALAVVSCQLYPGGLFNAYDALSRLDRLDAVVHLGDYIYEYGAEASDYGMSAGAALGRVPQPPHEIVSLADYRTRHAQYKSDPDLQAAHARAPFICVWDDHEVANDAWMMGAENHQPETEGDFATRKAAALRAYYEWMPIREPKAGALNEAINRSFDFGDLATLTMVETRLLARG